MKRLFSEDGRCNGEGNALDSAITNAITPIINDFINNGYDIRDVENIANASVAMTICGVIMINDMEKKANATTD